jgi:hypothetical protein
VLITIPNDWTAMRSRFVAPVAGGVKGDVCPQAISTARFDATLMGSRSWSPPIT